MLSNVESQLKRFLDLQSGSVFEVKCLCSRWREWDRKGCHSHQHYNIDFLWYEELGIWIWSWYLQWLQNAKTLNVEVFNFISQNSWKTGIPNLWTCHFESSEDIMTKFKSQALHVIRIKYSKAGGSGNPVFLITALWNIGILIHKQDNRAKHF